MTTLDFMKTINSQPMAAVIQQYPIAMDLLANYRLNDISKDRPLPKALEQVEDEILEEFGLERDDIVQNFCMFLETFSQT